MEPDGQEGTSNVNLENVYFGYREQLVTRGEGGDKLEVCRGVQQGSLVSDPGLGGAGEVAGPRHDGL